MEAAVSGPMLTITSRSSGASVTVASSAGLSARTPGRNSSTSGLVVCAKRLTRSTVSRVWRRNSGNARTAFASATFRFAVAWNTAFELRTKP